MNDQLLQLYSSKWDKLCSAFKPILEDEKLEVHPTNPLLLFIDKEEEFKNADIRVMIFGQETNGWFEEDSGWYRNAKIDIPPILKSYNDFYNSGYCWSYGGQFWNGFSKFCSLLNEKYSNKKIRYILEIPRKLGQ